MEGVIQVKEAPKVSSDNQIEASLHPLEELLTIPKSPKMIMRQKKSPLNIQQPWGTDRLAIASAAEQHSFKLH